ncbi:MAG: hypothetical protein AAB214_06660 [Fibrobacterota bacterium]
MKKTLLAAAVLALTSGAFAYDEYGTVAKGKTEVDVMYAHTLGMGTYDADAKKQDAEGSPVTYNPSLQVKYGVLDGLDVELSANYLIYNKDAGDASGLNKPQLDVKYVHALGFGGLIGVDLPFGGKDIVGKNPVAALRVGPVLAKTIDKMVFNGWALVAVNFEDKDKNKAANGLDVYFKPQYNVTDKIGPYLGVDYQTNLGKGQKVDEDGNTYKHDPKSYLLTVKPGINYILDGTYSAELNVPVTVIGQNNTATAGVYVGFYGVF